MNQVIQQSRAHRHPRRPKPMVVALRSAETAEERVRRLYATQGGPLLSWLFDEARRRGQDLNHMARELGVTYGYVNQLRNGLRSAANVSPKFSGAAARYLGVPEVVVMIVCGRLGIASFIQPQLSEEPAVDRAICKMMDNARVKTVMPVDIAQLPLEARKAMVALYCETAGVDLFGLQTLPRAVQFLQHAAMQHELNVFEARRGVVGAQDVDEGRDD